MAVRLVLDEGKEGRRRRARVGSDAIGEALDRFHVP